MEFKNDKTVYRTTIFKKHIGIVLFDSFGLSIQINKCKFEDKDLRDYYAIHLVIGFIRVYFF